MKISITNVVFTFLFIIFFSLIVKFYSSYFIEAYKHPNKLFPPDKGFLLNECQSWTKEIREFDVKEDEKAEEVPVLMYHRIIDDDAISKNHFDEDGNLYNTIVLSSEFAKQMELLHENNYITLNTLEFQLFMERKLDVPKNSILLTFDDGYKDNYIKAYPILKSYDFNAVLYLVTGWITKYQQKYNADQTQYLSKAELEKSCSVFEFQSHTYNMHYETKDGTPFLIDKSEDEVYKDFEASLINLDHANRSFAYPYGAYNRSNIEQLKKLNVNMAFTTDYKIASPKDNIYEIPRLAVFPDDTLKEFKEKLELDKTQE